MGTWSKAVSFLEMSVRTQASQAVAMSKNSRRFYLWAYMLALASSKILTGKDKLEEICAKTEM